jgi:hypothetical protein
MRDRGVKKATTNTVTQTAYPFFTKSVGISDASTFGAPQSTKMGHIPSPWRYGA